eukprot:GHVU01038345.1.p1 GENE.GHVU01038345.1~~GHVU01038345.1.p1  ORF type:complete len:316 (+),score=79.44 GHVU01038345.1:1478-2425(+)
MAIFCCCCCRSSSSLCCLFPYPPSYEAVNMNFVSGDSSDVRPIMDSEDEVPAVKRGGYAFLETRRGTTLTGEKFSSGDEDALLDASPMSDDDKAEVKRKPGKTEDKKKKSQPGKNDASFSKPERKGAEEKEEKGRKSKGKKKKDDEAKKDEDEGKEDKDEGKEGEDEEKEDENEGKDDEDEGQEEGADKPGGKKTVPKLEKVSDGKEQLPERREVSELGKTDRSEISMLSEAEKAGLKVSKALQEQQLLKDVRIECAVCVRGTLLSYGWLCVVAWQREIKIKAAMVTHETQYRQLYGFTQDEITSMMGKVGQVRN